MTHAEMMAVALAATPGPWTVIGSTLIADAGMLATLHWHSGRGDENEADKVFFATFDPPTIFALLAELDAAKARVAVMARALVYASACTYCVLCKDRAITALGGQP